ncbi:hypothetical protein JL721_2051 [Aureococcus anophagefferens]|nr:hypothetical protein JL721_2051 [Aureococcus anophagefferens]
MPSLGGVVANLKSDEWELRVDGLKQLQALGEARRAPRPQGPRGVAQGRGVADLVTKQLRDLRAEGFASADGPRSSSAASTRRQLDKDAAAAPPPKAALAHAAPAPAAPAPSQRARRAPAPSPRRAPSARGLPRRRDGETRAVGAVVGGRGGPAAGPAAAPGRAPAASEAAAARKRARGEATTRRRRSSSTRWRSSAARPTGTCAATASSRSGPLASPRVAASSGDGVAWRSLAEATHDAHHKVNLAALEALAATLRGCSDAVAGEAFSAVLDRASSTAAAVLGCAAVGAAKRLVDPRQPTRHAAGQALHELRRTFAPAVLLEGVAPALDRADRGPAATARAAFAAAARLAVAVRRCDAEAFADRCAALAAEHRRGQRRARDLAPARRAAQRRRHVARRAAPAEVSRTRRRRRRPPPAGRRRRRRRAAASPRGARKALGAVASERPGGGGGAADAGRAARGDVARLARLAGPAVDAAWRGYFDSLAHLLGARAASAPPGGRDAFLEGDESDDSDDGRSPATGAA